MGAASLFLVTDKVLYLENICCRLAVISHCLNAFFVDQARERQRKEEQERLEREAAEAERKRKEEEEAREKAACEAAEKEAAVARIRQEKALSLGTEPEKGPDVTQVSPFVYKLILFSFCYFFDSHISGMFRCSDD